ncbi:transposase [Streptomyces avermitilis]|uniref:transposase n=1 Tax=Streptomyces avermitilis TaxID=33903 RepID=UPI003812A5D1
MPARPPRCPACWRPCRGRRVRNDPRHRPVNRPTPPGTRRFTPIPKRWTLERSCGWLTLHRRLVRDYETLPASSEAMIHMAMTDLMAHRLRGETAISWRDLAQPHQPRIPG